MRICSKCKLSKDLEEFTKDKSQPLGITYECKLCRSQRESRWRKENPDKAKQRSKKHREKRREFYQSEKGVESSRKSHLKRTFGLSLNKYNELLAQQNNICAICKNEESCQRNKFLSVDHCHETNQIRGLLCNTCNRALGMFLDNEEYLQSAINYLKTFKIKQDGL